MGPPLSIRFFFSLFFLYLPFSASSSPHDESQKLIAFKSSLSNPSLLRDWLPDRDPCSFSGVTCLNYGVSSINLDFVPLRTDFRFVADFFIPLVHLEALSLSSTNISGSIAISECSRSLTSLDLSFNALAGSLSSLSDLGSCSNLRSLNLSGNFLAFAGKFSSGFKLTGLETLDLSYNQISGENAAAWVLSGGCRDLKVLSFRGNKISGDFDFSNCRDLRLLDLSSNNFSLAPVPAQFGECGSLEYLDLSENKFSGNISRAISSCKELTFLNISNNKFSGEIPVIPGKGMRFLSLADNLFHGEIPPGMADVGPSLVHLDLSSNNLSGNIPASFGAFLSLEYLNISSNNFGGEFPARILSKMSKLKQLVLSFNEFTGFLPENLSDFPGLEILDLSSNNFSGKIPTELCLNPRNSLSELYLQNNQFTGSIPQSLGNCTNLVSLHLGMNYLTGSIPSSLRYLSKLRDLKLWLNSLEGEIPQELTYIHTLETLILDFNKLKGSLPSSLSNCTKLNWLSLSNNRLTGEIPSEIGRLSSLAILKLSNNSFTGRIPPELGDCSSLIWLDLSTNLLNGSIPSALFKQSGKIAVTFISGKKFVYIKNDGSEQCHGAGNLLEFEGIRPEQLTRISTRNACSFTASTRVYGGHAQPTQPPFDSNGSMIFLDVSYNMLSGTIPKEIGTMLYLYILNLGHNNISGSIPNEIGDLKGLNILDLSSNKLEGMIPQSMVALTMLDEIDLSNNYLTGVIPQMGQLETFPQSRFLNNSGLCGYPLPRCPDASGKKPSSRHQKSCVKHASLLGSIAMALFSLFCIFGFIVIFMEAKKGKNEKDLSLESHQDRSNSNSGTVNTSWKLTSAHEARSINLSAFEKPLKKLTFADLLEATNGFDSDSLIGSGGFGDVYKAKLKDGSIVAIKKLIHVSGQGDREFTAEMETIGKIKHTNLATLLGYCKVKEERLLVYEYMTHGSLEDVLHNRDKNPGLKLNWSARRKIAIGAARGLSFLHHDCIPHIIHRDMKSSNVLLDENLNARVSDFGMARLMSATDTHLSVSTLAGTPGYVPPEYYQSFRCSTKGDVYSFGVVLLELLTGKRPTDSSDFGDDNNLVGWVKQNAKLRISDVFDRELVKEDSEIELELLQHLKVACVCLDDRPRRRPTMMQVMAMLIQAGGAPATDTTATDVGGFSSSVGFGSGEMEDTSMKEIPEISNDNT